MGAFRLLILFGLVFPTANVFACRGGEDTPNDSFSDAYSKANYALSGKVVSYSKAGKDTEAEFQVLKQFKGSLPARVSFKIETGRSCDLGKYVEKDSEWFILAGELGEKIRTASHTRRIFQATDRQDLERQILSVDKSKNHLK